MPLAKYYKMVDSLKNTYSIQALVNFSFYGVKSLLLLYLTQDLAMDMHESVSICTGMIACSYLISLVGGFFAARFVSLKICLRTSLSLFNMGILMLAFSHQDQFILYLGMTFFICGGGLFKPLVPLILDQSFTRRPETRERGFMIYYAILNVGSLFGFLICGFASHSYGKSMGFFAAGISAILSLLIILFSRVSSKEAVQSPSFLTIIAYYGSLFLINAVILLSIHFMDVFNLFFPFLLIGILLLFLSIYLKAPESEKKSILLCYLFAFFFGIFAAIFEQTHSSLSLFLEYKINRSPFGPDSWISAIPTPAFQGLGPLFAILYVFIMGVRKTQSSSSTVHHYNLKISFGFFAAAFAFIVLLGAIYLCPEDEKISLTWIILTYLCITIAEMSIVPTCLSAITTFSPPRLKGPFVSLWTLSIAYGTYFSGVIVKYSSSVVPSVSHTSAPSLDFTSIFFIAAIICLFTSLLVLLGTFFTSKNSLISSKI